MRLAVALTVVCALAVVARAEGKVVRAENVLPPGQSGYVSITGLPSGTGSPHLTDQTQLFLDFKRKPFQFGLTGEKEEPFPGVSITRDSYGVPIVTGDTELNAWKGAGYAIAQDRMFQLEAFRHATQGRLSDLVGESALEDDLVTRRDFYTPAERMEQFERLPTALRARVEAYRDGINVWVEHLQANPDEIPGEFPATGTPVTPWTTDDTLSVGIYLARTVPSGDGGELDNLQAIQESGSPRVLDRLLPIRIPGQRSTIPRSEGLFPQGKALSRKQERAARRRSLRFLGGLPKVGESRSAVMSARRTPAIGGSYMFAVRKPRGRGSLLFSGPQLGYSIPELFVELEVHAPGLHVRGVTAAGAPVIAIGHNDNVAFGVTSGLSDEDDLYVEEVVPGEPEKYRFKGEVRDMECRDETLTWSGPPSDILGGGVPTSGSRTERICRTVHGPVQLRQGGVAYARRYAIWGRELETFIGLAEVNVADDVFDVQRAMRKVTWNENMMAADSKGNIGYWHPGLVQKRPARWDQRLPLPGTGEAEWPGLVPRSKLPSIINPDQGYLLNWNNIPSQGWTSGDGPATERLSGRYHRASWLDRLVRIVRRKPTFKTSEDAVRLAGTFAQQRPLAARLLKRASRGAEGPGATVLRLLRSWDGDYDTVDGDNTVHPGVATWEKFKELAAKLATKPLGEGASEFSSRPGSSHVFDITAKEAYALRVLSRRQLQRIALDTFRDMRSEFGTPNTAKWRSPRAMYDVAAQGAGSAPEIEFFDRGTYEQIVELGR